MSDLRAIVRALGGEIAGGQVLAPGPGHSARDRSMSVRLSPSAPDGFLAFSHAGDGWRACRDYVRDRLGLPRAAWKEDRGRYQRPTLAVRTAVAPKPKDEPQRAPGAFSPPDGDRIAEAIQRWREGVDPQGTLAEKYLNSRALALADFAGEVLRWHPGVGAMLALFRNLHTNRPQAISRTFLDAKARKLRRMFLGPVGGAAIKLDADDAVTMGLHICEGVETGMAARQLGLKPTWALGSAGAIAAFPVLSGIECLTLLAEHDDASERAVQVCAKRWHEAGREVLINQPRGPGAKDLNDVIGGTA
jgi:putative DNA primase/helicase